MKLLSALNIIGALLLISNFSCTKIQPSKNVLVFGHAGNSLSEERYVYPPNTAEAIFYGLDVLGADGVEIDVQLTNDTNLFCYHDGFLEEFTDGVGCIAGKSSAELNNLKYYKKYELLDLSSALKICTDREKYILLDFKRYDYCSEQYINYSACNVALNKFIDPYNIIDKERIIASSNDLNLLKSFTDTSIIKCYETRDILEGIKSYKLFQMDLLVLHLTDLVETDRELLKNNQINYVLQGVKTKSEVKKAQNYLPFAIISDNIALTNKKIH